MIINTINTMRYYGNVRSVRGFTLLELIIVIAIIGVIIAILTAALGTSREKGRDANRATQLQEILKAAELYYVDTGEYPPDGAPNGSVAQLSSVTDFLIDNGGYLSTIPEDPKWGSTPSGYLYCSSNDGDSYTILVHTESSGNNYCYVSVGPDLADGPSGGYCRDFTTIDPPVTGACNDRF